MSNYFKSDSDMITVNGSLVFRTKRKLLEGFYNSDKSFKQYIKKRGNKKFKKKLLHNQVPKVYREAAKAPVDDNKVIFVEIRHPYITNSFQVVFDELVNKYDYTIHTHFLLNNKTTRADYSKRVLDAVEDIATAKYVFVNEASNALSAIPLRKETKFIQLWHGCGAFKKFGLSTADLIFGESRKEQLKFPFYKNYSIVTTSSPEVNWAYNEAMNIPEESGIVQALGSSRTDIFFNDEFISAAYDHLYEVFPQAKGKKVILYAPTFRGRVAKAQAPDMLNLDMFYEGLGDEYVVLFNYHPLVEKPPVVPERHKDFALDVGGILGIDELLCVSDICISDYSSLVFEYSLFEKPLILFAYDLDNYCDWRGFYYDFYELAPGLIAKTNFEMIDYIQNIEERFDKKAIQDFRYKFMRSCDGHATERILEAAFENLEEHKKPCENFEHFYMVPTVQNSRFPYHKEVEKLRKTKLSALKLYAEAVKADVEKGSIIAVDIKNKAVREQLKKNKIKRFKSKELEETVSAVAKAEYVLIDSPNHLLDALDLRRETKVVYIPSDAFPLKKFGVNTKEYRSGLKKEIYELAPLFSSVNIVCASSEKDGEIFKEALGRDVEVLLTGDVVSDILFDKKKIEKLKKDLVEAYPKFEGKKIITLIAKEEHDGDDSFLYEYLGRDYVILKHFEKSDAKTDNKNNSLLEDNYYADSIIDVSGMITKYEALAISDIVIGGFDSSVFSYMATGKPVIIYSANARDEMFKTESFVDLKQISPTPVLDNIKDVIKIVMNVENYNYKKYNALKEEYLQFSDGKAAKRLVEALKSEKE